MTKFKCTDKSILNEQKYLFVKALAIRYIKIMSYYYFLINSINKDIEYFFAKTPKLDSTGEKESEDIDDAGTLFDLK